MISAAEIQIIARDGKGLSSTDREILCEAAQNLDHIRQAYGVLQRAHCEAQMQLAAQEERLIELARLPVQVYGDAMLCRLHYNTRPSWMRFEL